MTATADVTAATWACVRDRRLLVVRPHGQDAFYLPGGTPEPGETSAETAVREVAEEVGIHLQPEHLELFAEIVAPAYGRPGVNVRLICFTAPSDGTPEPANEIAAVEWITGADAERCAPAVQSVLALLVGSGAVSGTPTRLHNRVPPGSSSVHRQPHRS